MDVSYSTQETQPLINPDVHFTGIEDLPQSAHVEFTDLHEGKFFFKKQCRKYNIARQIVTNGLVHMKAKCGPDQLLKIRGWVRREPRAAELVNDKNGAVLICGIDNRELNLITDEDVPSITEDGYTLQPFSFDLGEIYEGPEQPVFTLARTDTEARNKFQLIIQLVFLHGPPSQKFVSPTFICCTQKRTQVNSEPGGPEPQRRRQDDSGTTNGLGASFPWLESGDNGLPDDTLKYKKVLVETLEAKTAFIKDLVAHDVHFETAKADIAYHLKIKDPDICEELEEGDIVGFYGDEESGETYIQPLRSGNIYNAVHAGVVSRSHWMEGNKSHGEGSVTDTVCVIGIVNVKVVGSVENGERIYASRDRPGKAIPQSHMPVGSFLRKKHVLLGMALESKRSSRSLDEVHLTKCFVCIVLDVSRQELLQEIEDLYEVNEKRTEEQIRLSSKKTWRRFKCCFGITAVILAFAIFVMYQWLAPGSMFRYWLCRRGSIPGHHIYFECFDSHKRLMRVHGIRFTYDELQRKVGINFVRNGEAYYYLNIDRCAYYWIDGAAGNNIGGHKYVGGGRILSVFKNCSTVYECAELQGKWKRVDNKTNSVPKCVPMPG